MAGMADASNPTAGMPILPAQVAKPIDNVASRLQTAQMASGLGMLPSFASPPVQGPQLPPMPVARPTAMGDATAPFSASPAPVSGMPVVSSVAGGGYNGPTMTPQELVAAKQASVAPFFQGVIGPGAVQARQDMSAAYGRGDVAGAVGDAIRGVGLTAAYGVSQPVVAGAQAIGDGVAYAAHGVSQFARHLFGAGDAGPDAPDVPAAQAVQAGPAQVAYTQPATQPTALGAMPGLSPGPRPGVAQFTAPNGTTSYVASSALDAVPARGMPPAAGTAASAAPAPVAAPAASAQTSFEKQLGIPAGGVNQLLANARPSQRTAVLAQLVGLQQSTNAEGAKSAVRTAIMENHGYDLAGKTGNADTDAAIQNRRKANNRLAENLIPLVSPSGAQGALGLQSYEQ